MNITRFYLLFLIIINTLLSPVKSARILAILPSPSLSHQLFFQPIIKELTLRDHEVVVINPTKLGVEIKFQEVNNNPYWDRSLQGFGQFRLLFQMIVKASNVIDFILSQEKVQNIINDPDEYFDLILVEWGLYPATTAFAERFNCSFIGISSLDMTPKDLFTVGSFLHPGYMTDSLLSFSAPTNLYERLINLFHTFGTILFHYFMTLPIQDQIARSNFGNNISYIGDIEKRVTLVLANSVISHIGMTRPALPNVIDIGGINQFRTVQPLSKDLKRYINNSRRGVIYFSLGIGMDTKNIDKEQLTILTNVFAKLPYKILWKWDSNTAIPNQPANVKVAKWFPQNAILGHPNVKLFITQGGLLSIEEAIHHKVPMLVMPFWGDQGWNADRIEKMGIGLKIDFKSMSEKDLYDSINVLIRSPIYRDKISKVSDLLHDQPEKPLDKAIWWIEYAIRNKGWALHTPAADMPWYQVFFLDIVAFFVFCGFIVFMVTCLILYILYSAIRTVNYYDDLIKHKHS